VFPVNIKKIPSVVGTPWQYYLVIHSVVSPEQFSDLRLAVFEELGYTEACFEFLFHLSQDILKFQIEEFKKKPREGVLAQFNCDKLEGFVDEVILMNSSKFRPLLKDICSDLKRSEKIDSELVAYV